LPARTQEFTKKVLYKPIAVSSGQKSVGNLQVIQDIEYAKPENKLVDLLEALKKTAPPVLIFCDSKYDVDSVQEYLLAREVDAVSLYSGQDKNEAAEAVRGFNKGKKDVLILTDIVARGLELPNVKHVISFSLPREFNNYVKRIARTGKRGAEGLATTFISKSSDHAVIYELKEMLVQAGQAVPSFLQVLKDPEGERIRCTFCGSNQHKTKNCLKLDQQKLRNIVGYDDEKDRK